MEILAYTYEGKSYDVFILRKKVKNITYRYRDGAFYISASRYVSVKMIMKHLNVFGPRLLKRSEVKNEISHIGNGFVYYLGDQISYEGENNLEKFYTSNKSKILNIYETRVRFYEKIMNISAPYKVKIRNAKTRFGSNSGSSHSIMLSSCLIHYSLEIIDSVVIHELCHDKIKNHSKKFYDLLLFYCPNYYECRKKLIKGIHQ